MCPTWGTLGRMLVTGLGQHGVAGGWEKGRQSPTGAMMVVMCSCGKSRGPWLWWVRAGLLPWQAAGPSVPSAHTSPHTGAQGGSQGALCAAKAVIRYGKEVDMET